jgi:hypothetical protein
MGLYFHLHRSRYIILWARRRESSNERQIVDGNFGACPRCAKSRSGGSSSAYIMVSLCMARTLASPRCLWCSAVWVEIGNAKMASLTFIPCTVTSIFIHLPRLLSANILAFDRIHAKPICLYCHTQERPGEAHTYVCAPKCPQNGLKYAIFWVPNMLFGTRMSRFHDVTQPKIVTFGTRSHPRCLRFFFPQIRPQICYKWIGISQKKSPAASNML